MLFADNNYDPIEHLTVDLGLKRKPIKRVAITFQLYTCDFAVYDCHVYANSSGPHAHLFNNTRVCIASVKHAKPISNGYPYIAITHPKAYSLIRERTLSHVASQAHQPQHRWMSLPHNTPYFSRPCAIYDSGFKVHLECPGMAGWFICGRPARKEREPALPAR